MIKKSVLAIAFTALVPLHAAHAQDTGAADTEKQTAQTETMLTPEIGGIQQFIQIKTDDPRKPVLLFLSGGPGSSMMKGADRFTDRLKKNFTIVQWDQRDAGRTLERNPSPSQPSVAQMARDTQEVIDFVRHRLNQEKIYLLGSSWGNVLGFHIVKHRPQVLHAYFAVNPVISQLASEKELLTALTTHFNGNPTASKELATVKIPFQADEDLFYLRKWLFVKEGKAFATGADFKAGFLQWSKSWAPVWTEVMNIDLPKTLPAIDCPIFFLVGKNDLQTSTTITKAYFHGLSAPIKDLFIFENAGHQIHQEEPVKFQDIIIKTIRPQERPRHERE